MTSTKTRTLAWLDSISVPVNGVCEGLAICLGCVSASCRVIIGICSNTHQTLTPNSQQNEAAVISLPLKSCTGWDANRMKADVASSCMTVESRTADVCECEWTLRFDFHCHWSSLVVIFPPISFATHSGQSQVTLPLSAQAAEKEAALHPQHLGICCILVPPGSSAALSRFPFGMLHHSKLASCIGRRVAHTTESLFETLAMYEGPLGS